MIRFYPAQPTLDTIPVSGNWGTMHVCRLTGWVQSLDEDEDAHAYEPEEIGYRDIVKVDLTEFYKTYGADDESETIDVLDVGCWFTDGAGGVDYLPHEQDWRENIIGLINMPGYVPVIHLGAH